MNEEQRKLLENVVIVDLGNTVGIRTAITKAKRGGFKNVRPDDLASHLILEVIERTKIDPEIIADIVLGCAFPEGEQGMEMARVVAIRAGVEKKESLEKFIKVPGYVLNRFCASGLQAIASGVFAVALGINKVVIVGGAESMTMIPMVGTKIAPNPALVENYPDFYLNMGLTAENLAQLDNISREQQDEFSYQSHIKALKALEEGKWKNEILPFKVREIILDEKGKKISQEFIVDTDEGPRKDINMTDLAKLKPAFKINGTVTAGNSSQMSDGAAVLLVMSEKEARNLGLKPIARLISYQVRAVPPEIMGIGPVEAVPAALNLANLKIEDIDLIELNEAFAAQSLSVIKRLKEEKKIDLPLEKVNVLGGAIALGHPLGCTGAYLTIKGLNELRRRKGKYLMVTMCIGGGQGAAGIFEALY